MNLFRKVRQLLSDRATARNPWNVSHVFVFEYLTGVLEQIQKHSWFSCDIETLLIKIFRHKVKRIIVENFTLRNEKTMLNCHLNM